jgi:hypothetical protein
MSLDATGLFNALVSHAQSLGLFDHVNSHEGKNAPGKGLTCDITLGSVGPVPAASGLAAVSGRVEFRVRIFTTALQQDYDSIDPTVLSAVDALFAAYSGAFTLGGTVRDIDLLGQHGTPLRADAVWVKYADGQYRAAQITVPIILNDLWTETA